MTNYPKGAWLRHVNIWNFQAPYNIPEMTKARNFQTLYACRP